MSEQQKNSIVKEQQKTKPKIDEIIPIYLDGESKQSLIELLEFCRVNEIKAKWSATNRWKFVYKKSGVGMIYIGARPCLPNGRDYKKNQWFITVNIAEDFVIRENLTEVIHKNVLLCVRGQKNCLKREISTVLGKEYINACNAAGSMYANPNAESLECIKRILKFRIDLIASNL